MIDQARLDPKLLDALYPRLTDYIPHEPTVKQLAGLMLPHKEVFFGGAAGGGKSDWLLMSALQYVDVPGYAAILFRRTLTDLELPGSILDRAHEWLNGTDAKWIPHKHSYKFPSGAVLQFGYIGESNASARYQGIEVQFCTAAGTLVRMADGNYRAVETLRPGLLVETLQGPKRIKKVYPARKKFCVRVGDQIHGYDHRIMNAYGTWSSYVDLYRTEFFESIESGTYGKDERRILDLFLSFLGSRLGRYWDSSQLHEDASVIPVMKGYWPGFFAWLVDAQNGSAKFDDARLRALRLPTLYVQPMQYGLAFQSMASSVAREAFDALGGSKLEDSQYGYSAYPRQYDGPCRTTLDSGLDALQLQGDVVEHTPAYYSPDAWGNTPTRSHRHSTAYVHPYTKVVSLSQKIAYQPCPFSLDVEPLGFLPVYDIQVEDENHYITSSNFINANCGFDEVAQHWEEDYLYLFSRLRKLACPVHKLDDKGKPIYVDGCSLCDLRRIVPLRMRSASNPPRAGDRGSTGWIKDRFRIELQADGSYRGCHPKRPHIPSYLEDNPFIDQSSYDEGLQELDPVTREQLRRGDWGVSADGRFRKSWARYYKIIGGNVLLFDSQKTTSTGRSVPINKCRLFVTCDPAASLTEGPGDAYIWRKAPSHTVISTWLLTPDFDLIWYDLDRFQKEIPDIFPALAANYRKHKPQFLAIEANGLNVGVYQVAKRLGLPVRPLMPKGDKVVRSTDAAVRMEAGKIFLPLESELLAYKEANGGMRRKPWREIVEQELFTWTGHKQEAADIIDTLSYAALLVSDEASRHERGIKSFATPSAVGD